MQDQKAYSILSEKKFTEDDNFFYIEGVASTPTPDRVGDIMRPMGAKYSLPQKMLLHHEMKSPVGNMIAATLKSTGIPCKWALPKVKEAGRVKERVDEAIHSVKYDLISALSIGFRAMEGKYKVLKSGGYEFFEWDWFETSLVTIPANSEAIITAVKSFEASRILTATGHTGKAVQLIYPGATGQKSTVSRPGSVKLIPKA